MGRQETKVSTGAELREPALPGSGSLLCRENRTKHSNIHVSKSRQQGEGVTEREHREANELSQAGSSPADHPCQWLCRVYPILWRVCRRVACGWAHGFLQSNAHVPRVSHLGAKIPQAKWQRLSSKLRYKNTQPKCCRDSKGFFVWFM